MIEMPVPIFVAVLVFMYVAGGYAKAMTAEQKLVIAEAFHKVAVAERDYERVRAQTCETRVEQLREQLRALAQEMRTAAVEEDSLAYYADMIDRVLR